MAPLPPDPGQLPQPHRIAEVRDENPTIRSFVLEGTTDAAPGQFVMAWLPGLDEKPFSPSCADPLTLTVDRVGPFTTAMHALSRGDHIWLRGPFGRGFALCEGPLMLICGGCGAAPLHRLAQLARGAGRKVHVILGARTADGIFFAERYAALGCVVHVTTDDGSAGHRGTAIDDIVIEIKANGFLYRMVRNIVGSLVEVGQGKQRPDWIAEVLAARDRKLAGPTAPPQGLFLAEVRYDHSESL